MLRMEFACPAVAVVFVVVVGCGNNAVILGGFPVTTLVGVTTLCAEEGAALFSTAEDDGGAVVGWADCGIEAFCTVEEEEEATVTSEVTTEKGRVVSGEESTDVVGVVTAAEISTVALESLSAALGSIATVSSAPAFCTAGGMGGTMLLLVTTGEGVAMEEEEVTLLALVVDTAKTVEAAAWGGVG